MDQRCLWGQTYAYAATGGASDTHPTTGARRFLTGDIRFQQVMADFVEILSYAHQGLPHVVFAGSKTQHLVEKMLDSPLLESFSTKSAGSRPSPKRSRCEKADLRRRMQWRVDFDTNSDIRALMCNARQYQQ